MNRFSIFLSALALALSACGTTDPAGEERKREDAAKVELTLRVLDSKEAGIWNHIDHNTYEYFAAGDSYWTGLYETALHLSGSVLSEVNLEELDRTVSGIQNLGYVGNYKYTYQADRCEGLWKVVLSYKETQIEVVNGEGAVVCRYKRRENFSRICEFIGYRLRETYDASLSLYTYCPMSIYQVPIECRNKMEEENNGYYASVDLYMDEKGQPLVSNFFEFLEADYAFDERALDNPVSYVPPPPVPSADQPGGSGSTDSGRRPYKFVKSVDAYTLYSDLDVDETTVYIYKGPDGDRASLVYNPDGLERSATELIRRGSATIDGRSYSCYILSLGIPTYFNY